MLDTGLVNDPEIIQATKESIADLRKELEAESQKPAEADRVEEAEIIEEPAPEPQPKKKKATKATRKVDFSWKKKADIKKMKPVTLHCQHYHLAVQEPMVVGLKGSGNATRTVPVKPGEHLIFDDQGHLVLVMNAVSYKRKCVEKRSVAEHIKAEHQPAVAKVPEKKKDSKPAPKKTSQPEKPEAQPARRSPVELLEAEIRDVAKIVAKPDPSKAEIEKLPTEIKEAAARSRSKTALRYIEKQARKLRDEKQTLTKDEVIKLAIAAAPLIRSERSILLDSLLANKKVLPPTEAGLLRWLKNPSVYDLPGVDIARSAEPTVKRPRRPGKGVMELLGLA